MKDLTWQSTQDSTPYLSQVVVMCVAGMDLPILVKKVDEHNFAAIESNYVFNSKKEVLWWYPITSLNRGVE